MYRLYLDTSVFGGYFDPEFEIWTKILFDKIQSREYIIAYSKLVDIELNPAPGQVKELVQQIPRSSFEFISISDEAIELAQQYISENVVGRTSMADCIHIAIATPNNVDILVSWNFKHIVNINRIRGYNAVNYKLGYRILEIRTPREILEYEE